MNGKNEDETFDILDDGNQGKSSLKKKKTRRNGKGGSGTKEYLNRLSKATKQNSFQVEPLHVGTLRPLVDLAYWSTFVEVRRDAAAAFATLAMNEMNLPILSESGALGAVIALIGLNNEESDSQIHRDAATALAYLLTMEDVKRRFLRNPHGLKSLFYICRSPSIEVKRAAVKVFANLATLAETKEALVIEGGIKYLFSLATATDEKTKRRAAIVLKRLASHPPNHERICTDENAVRCAISLLIECNDLTIRRDLMVFVMSIASNNSRKQTLVDSGILTPLLMHVDPQHASLETITLVINCIHTLSGCPNVLETMVDEGIIEALSRVIFSELKEIRAYRLMRRSQMKKKPHRIESKREEKDSDNSATCSSTNSSLNSRRSKVVKPQVELEEDALRFGLQILLNLSAHKDLRDGLVEREIPSALYEEAILESTDKRIKRTTAKILVNLTNSEGRQSKRHDALVESGILYPIRLFLRGSDFILKAQAAKMASYLARTESSKLELGKHPEILKLIVGLCNPHDEEVNKYVAKFLAELSDSSISHNAIVHAGGLQALIFMISPRSKNKDVRLESVRAMANVSAHHDSKVKLVQFGALGYLISMSKSGTGLTKMYALATLTNLEHDSAALRIQMVFRGYISRRRAKRKKQLMEEKEAEQEQKQIEESKQN